MSEKVKSVFSTVNLPVQCINTISNFEDVDLLTKVEDMMKNFSKWISEDGVVKSMNTKVVLDPSQYGKEKKYVEPYFINIQHSDLNIHKIEKKKIEKTNDIKFYSMKVEFSNGLKKELIVPSYVKFYCKHVGIFKAVEKLHSRDILVDYSFRDVHIEDPTLIEDFKMTEFYSIKVSYDDVPEDYDSDIEKNKQYTNFYLDGILVNVPYNNFQKKEN